MIQDLTTSYLRSLTPASFPPARRYLPNGITLLSSTCVFQDNHRHPELGCRSMAYWCKKYRLSPAFTNIVMKVKMAPRHLLILQQTSLLDYYQLRPP